jgi:hypothetical protein
VLQRLTELAGRAAAAIIEVALVSPPEQHPDHGRIGLGRAYHPPSYAEQPVARRPRLVAVLPPDQLQSPALRLTVGRNEQGLLATEVPIDRAFGHAGPSRDLRGGGRPESDGGEQLECGAQELLPGGGAVAAGW